MSGKSTKHLRTGLILVIVVLAFVASYQLATAAERDSAPSADGSAGSLGLAAAPTADGSPACACCGDGANAEPIEGAAVSDGEVQRITVDTSKGYYDPNVITLTAGVPAEITFTQASGCLAQVESPDFGFAEDLTGGDVSVRIEAEQLTPGTYGFNCGMQMTFGTIIVE